MASQDDLVFNDRHVDRITSPSLDSYISAVGVLLVLNNFLRFMKSAPKRIEEACLDLRDAFILKEYNNVRSSVTRGEGRPNISLEAAECLYLMCLTVDYPIEPHNNQDIEVLRGMFHCSAAKSFRRLYEIGAIKEEN
jgi:hypothetical protein